MLKERQSDGLIFMHELLALCYCCLACRCRTPSAPAYTLTRGPFQPGVVSTRRSGGND